MVNTGNMMMRWTNDRYISNLHRVINKSGKDRYSIVFFFDGNPDYVVKCLPGLEEAAKYPAVSVADWIQGRYADTYPAEASRGKAIGEMLEYNKVAGAV